MMLFASGWQAAANLSIEAYIIQLEFSPEAECLFLP